MKNTMKDHWEHIYASTEIERLGWYEDFPEPSIRLLSRCTIDKEAHVLDAGAGASKFIDYLVDHGYENVIAVDISEMALRKTRERLGEEKSRNVMWIIDDITKPAHVDQLSEIDLWHDRALLHFLTGDKERRMYMTVLEKVVRKGGFVIIAAFSLSGAKKCSGLDVMNYDENLIADFLGKGFKLIEHFDHTYYTPSGEERPYVYTLFKRSNEHTK